MDIKALIAEHGGDVNKALAEMTRRLQTATTERDAAVEAAKKAKGIAGKLTLKVSEKGGLSVYGMGRFPVTLYREQWERLLDNQKQLRDFIAANGDALKVKGADAVEDDKTGTEGK